MCKRLIFSLLIFSVVACKKQTAEIHRGIYFWKSAETKFNEFEKSFLNDHEIKKVYIKVFEVEYNDNMGAIPISKSKLSIGSIGNKEIVPTIFIKNEVFKKISEEDIELLASNILELLNDMGYALANAKSKSGHVIQEIQIDCDWTSTSKEQYFKFLRVFKKLSQAKLSCTLRLYPYKYPKLMGVPPVDRATLMCYNLIEPLNSPQQNSILDIETLGSYLNKKNTYPIPLDLALPLYSWIQIYKNGRFHGLSYDIAGLQSQKTQKIDDLWYQATDDFFLSDILVRPGDRLKIETIEEPTIHAAIEILVRHFNFSNSTILFFHLDENQLKKYNNEQIEAFYNRFSVSL